jgi:CMP-N,N'-diacetyllegionaminic acid synthase
MNTKNVLAIITARGGSKGIINKNLRLLRGKPLIQHAIDYAKSSQLINKIVVSTDSDDIAATALALGVEVIKRPPHMAGDKSLVIDAVRHVVTECEKNHNFSADIVVLLECTSPIKSTDEINKAIEVLAEGRADSATTFRESAVSPNRLWKVEGSDVRPYIDGANPFLPRQSQPVGYELTGQVYAITAKKLMGDLDNVSFIVGEVYPIVTSVEVVDIDNERDLVIAEAMLGYIEEAN